MSFPRYERYKDSGVEWLDEVPDHWQISRLGFETWVRARLGWRGLKADEYVDDGFIFLSTPNIKARAIDFENVNYISKQRFEESPEIQLRVDDVLLAKDGSTLGTVNVVRSLSRGATVNSSIAVITPGEAVSGVYLNYLFQSNFMADTVQRNKGGMGVPHLFQEDLKKFYIPLPPLDEQYLIGAFLDLETQKIEGLVEEQRRLIELLKEKRQAVISHAVTRGLDISAPTRKSGVELLASIPVGWTAMTVTRVLERIEQGWSPECIGRPADLEEWGVVKSGCVNRGVFVESENKTLPEELDPMAEYEIVAGDILMSRASGSPDLVGSTALVGEVRPRLMLSDKTFRIRLVSTVDARFFVYLFNSYLMRSQIERAISGADGLANNLPQAALKRFWLALPPKQEQARISLWIQDQIGHLNPLLNEAEQGIEILQERRSALISAAVTGKIDLRQTARKPVAAVRPYTSGFAHQLLAATILERCNDSHMGRTKLQKLIHMAEYHAQIDELRGAYTRKMAGPLDMKAMRGLEAGLKRLGWFSTTRDAGRGRYRYTPLDKHEQHRKYLGHWTDKQARIDEVLNLMGRMTMRQCEIVSTLYAAWNDLLIDKIPPTHEAILAQATTAEGWHENKEKTPPQKWAAALQWMKDKRLVPTGFGSHTRKVNSEDRHEPA